MTALRVGGPADTNGMVNGAAGTDGNGTGQYTPYSRVKSVMAWTFSTLASFWMMALASMM